MLCTYLLSACVPLQKAVCLILPNGGAFGCFCYGQRQGGIVLFKITRCAFGERALTSVGRIMHCCDLLLVVTPSPLQSPPLFPGARYPFPHSFLGVGTSRLFLYLRAPSQKYLPCFAVAMWQKQSLACTQTTRVNECAQNGLATFSLMRICISIIAIISPFCRNMY